MSIKTKATTMTAWNVWDRVRRAAHKAGLEELVSPHFLRHSHGTHALQRGADLATGRYLHVRAWSLWEQDLGGCHEP